MLRMGQKRGEVAARLRRVRVEWRACTVRIVEMMLCVFRIRDGEASANAREPS